jgi:predicted metal-dependent HD superfamily phosphohydrolase
VWWHDVIYDPLSGDNETESANLANYPLKRQLTGARIVVSNRQNALCQDEVRVT